ncbi:hypothetical protein EX30DRAFT_115365 [Ascodesmis nigricans]|uniref:Uncharacterized protein n=1 Tax=Ascodesmis nigricans TaxID=341454 RepID=A0A4S2MQ41_9PEZI|nr:hypothetical protein EX30DRAFT_115365 [Ascodesmis nigricans]
MFRKDSSIFRPTWGRLAKKGTLPPHPSAPPDPLEAPEPPKMVLQKQKAYRGMLLLPMKHFPDSLDHPTLADKDVIDILPIRTADTTRRSKEKVVFDSDSAIRQVQIRERRQLKERKMERDRRSMAPGYLESRAPHIFKQLEHLDALDNELRRAAQEENQVLELRELSAAQKRWTWGKDDKQVRAEMEAKYALTAVQPLPWVREHHPALPLPTLPASSADSTYSRRSSYAASIRSLSYRDSSRDSVLTVSTRYSSANVTARSSIMSVMTQATSIGSPTQSEMPSPSFSCDMKDQDDVPRGLSLPGPITPIPQQGGARLGQVAE